MLVGDLSQKSEYILRNGGFYRRNVTDEYLGGQEHILSTLVQPQPVILRNFVQIGDQPVQVAANASNLTMAILLKSLPMRIALSLNEAATQLVAEDSHNFLGETPTGFAGTLVTTPWAPPSWGKLYFFLNMVNIGIPGSYNCESCYLLMKDTNTGDFIAPYYPNVYDNGRICMGREWDANKDRSGADSVAKFIAAYNSFHATRMNNHLVDAGHVRLFRMNIDPTTGTPTWHHPASRADYGRVTSLAFLPNFKQLI